MFSLILHCPGFNTCLDPMKGYSEKKKMIFAALVDAVIGIALMTIAVIALTRYPYPPVGEIIRVVVFFYGFISFIYCLSVLPALIYADLARKPHRDSTSSDQN